MKKNYFSGIVTVLLTFFISTVIAQNQEERQQIIKDYNLNELQKLESKYRSDFKKEKAKAERLARVNNWPVSYNDENGNLYELIMISDEGNPIYYQTDNVDAAISTRANYLHNGGGLGLNLEGQGMTAHVWDGGLARGTHQEYDGPGGENRYSIGDNSSALSFHGAHVTGTIIASGVNSDAKGMAPQASAVGHDWNDDLAEATAAAANGMLLSNHSYGFNATAIPDWWFGAYLQVSSDWDNLMFNAPYYLMVNSAGNDGNNNSANADPLEGNSSFDKISGRKASKNAFVVANGQDATINGDGSLGSVARNSGSSEGPTDDLRIKPDIMGNGTGLFSTYESSDTAYNTISGTSMASPNVCGSMLLLQQYHNESYGSFMKAATLKGLVLHTADDIEMVGPDAETGWGLMNTKAAAEVISNNGLGSWISEETLSNGESFTMTVESDGSSPLMASISWTDRPGVANTGTANDGTPVLVNDLDIRITKDASTFSPWRLTAVNANDMGDNVVDPYERVDVNGASGTYTITVTHKGSLVGGSQNFSLIVTGVSSDFTINSSNTNQTVCSDIDAIYNFNYQQVGGGATNLSVNGLPNGATVDLSASSLSSTGDFTVTIGDLVNLPADTYTLDIIGDNGSETETRTLTLRVLHPDFSNNLQVITSPADGSTGVLTSSLIFDWEENLNAESYNIEISTDPTFSTVDFNGTETGLNFNATNLADETVYYWRVRPDNRCNNGIYSPIYSFQTGIIDCSNTFTATDFTDATIPFNQSDFNAFVPIEVTGGLTINSITVNTDISHGDVEDLIVYLQEPAALGSNNVILLENPCDLNDNIENTTFDDTGADLVCNAGTPAISGTIKPQDLLSSTAGKDADGTWFLGAFDTAVFNGGVINSASITICTSEENTNVPNFTNNGINVSTNSTYTTVPGDIEVTTASETASEQVYTLIELPAIGELKRNGTDLAVGDTFTQEDVNTSLITYTNTETAAFNDQMKVGIINSANGWLGNQIVTITATLLSNDEFNFKNLVIWPNPTKGEITVNFNSVNSQDVTISLFDIQGRKIKESSHKINGGLFQQTIDYVGITNGVYLLNIKQGNREITKRVIVSD